MARNTSNPNLMSKKIGDVLNIFTDLLCSNHPNDDLNREITCSNGTIIPAFNKQRFASSIIFKMINSPFSKMVIRDKEEIIFETTNVDMMFVGLKYFGAYVEDTIRIGTKDSYKDGFCWRVEDKYYTVVLE